MGTQSDSPASPSPAFLLRKLVPLCTYNLKEYIYKNNWLPRVNGSVSVLIYALSAFPLHFLLESLCWDNRRNRKPSVTSLIKFWCCISKVQQIPMKLFIFIALFLCFLGMGLREGFLMSPQRWTGIRLSMTGLRVLWQCNLAGHQCIMKTQVPSGIFIRLRWLSALPPFFIAWFLYNCSNLHIITLDLLFKCHLVLFLIQKPAAVIKSKRTRKCEILSQQQ